MKWAIGTVVAIVLVLLIAVGLFLIILAGILFVQSRQEASVPAPKPATPGPAPSPPVIPHTPVVEPPEDEIGFADDEDEQATVVMMGSSAMSWKADESDGEARTEVLQRWHIEDDTVTGGNPADYGLLDD